MYMYIAYIPLSKRQDRIIEETMKRIFNEDLHSVLPEDDDPDHFSQRAAYGMDDFL